MKRYILCLTLLLAIASASFARTYALTDTVKKDTTKKATAVPKDTIKFIPNKPIIATQLEVSSSSGTTTSSKTSIKGASMVQQSSAMTSSFSSGSDAGRTVGSLDVSGSGAATYTVPVAVPPGINGVAPQIALTYNSQGGPGIAGYGWNISGISAITRIPQTLFHDGVVGGVNANISDRYALDGQRLLLKSGTYGADGAEYQTENYSNIRVVSRGSMGTGMGPQYFDVYYPDGSHAIFGQNTDSFTKTTYAINYIDNPIGARISYVYTKSNETVVISQINYGALSTGTPMNQINFVYTTRNRNEQSYIGGTALYQTSLLSEIDVTGSGPTGYRNYVLDHDQVADLNYDRVTGIQELSGDRSKSFDPITFAYNNTTGMMTGSSFTTGLSSVNSTNSKTVTADFTGNGKMDLLIYPTYSKNIVYLTYDPVIGTTTPTYSLSVDPFEEVFAVNTLDTNDKLLNGQGFTFVHQTAPGTIKFRTWLPVSGSTAAIQSDEKVWNFVPTASDYYSECIGATVQGAAIPRDFFSGDFNGDGLTDIIAISKPYTDITAENIQPGIGCVDITNDVTTSAVHYMNLDRRASGIYPAGNLAVSYTNNDRIYTADFNGDGKTDILLIKSGIMYVYGLDDTKTIQLLWSQSDTRIDPGFEPLLGDYNGDGKQDIMFPTTTNSLFAVFMSIGTGFEKHEKTYGFSVTSPYSSGSYTTQYYLTANDMNGDGKTDIVSSSTYTGGTTGNVDISIYDNISNAATGEPDFYLGTTGGATGLTISNNPIPLFFNTKEPNFALEYGFYSNSTMNLFQHQKDNRKDVIMNQVSQNGVDMAIDYQELIPGTTSGVLPLYQKLDATVYSRQVYPYTDMDMQPGMYAVSQLTRTYNSNSLVQYFGYNGGVSHTAGLGFLGFHETVRSNWITGTTDDNRKYSTTVYDPQLRGAVLRSFISKDPFTSTNTTKNKTGTLPDIELSNAVTTAQTVVASHSITLKPGFDANGTNGTFIAKLDDPVNGIDDGGTTTSSYITRTDYTYNTQLLASNVFINNPISVVTKDLLNKTNTVATYTYDGNYNVLTENANFSGMGTKNVTSSYDSPTSGYIGRINDRIVTTTIGGDSFSTEDQYTYTGALVSQYKHKGNGTPFITEDYGHDSYGNITTKTVSTPSDGSRGITMAYDGTGRFNTSVTDVQGLTTTVAYDAVTGNVTSKLNPYSQTTSYTYDVWGRPTVTTDYLNHTNTRSYTRSGADMVIADVGQDGSAGSTTIDALGQTTITTGKDVLGQVITKEFAYDIYGRQNSETEPGIGSGSSQVNLTEYDEYGRVKKLTAYTGKITNISYTGLQTTVDDGTKTVTTTKDALGNVVTVQDPGGTINNTYFGNGNLKSADYGGSAQTIEQDGWGHKTKLTDPSAGIYTYTYDQFGQVKTETTPKGTTTYTYNADGSIATKNITGDNTSMAYSYTYNTNKTLHIVGLTNGDGNNTTYTYGYDGDTRVNSIAEVNPQAEFTKTLTYDGFGRVDHETNQAKNVRNSITQSKTITNNYQYGQLKSITDNGTSNTIWDVSALNARGQVTTALLGTLVKQTNTFDSYGYPTDLKTEKNVSGSWTTQQDLTYTFDAARGNVTNRKNYAFSPTWNEDFTYDRQDRLTDYNDNSNNHSQSYDSRGRIANNSQVGDYTYTGTSYQQAKVTNPSAFALYHYQQQPTQTITYNAFKEPVTINEQSKDIVDFEYNGSLQRAHMYYGNTNTNKTTRPFVRHYSEDGSMEITEDIPNSKTSFVFYLGGDAYTAPAIWKYEQTGSTATTNSLYYLLRDHLSSITMITDASGSLMEKRQFDAWGNIIKMENALGAITSLAILDRGYTGHEHLQGVGLINMNARLYDPILHRFLSPDAVIQDPFNTQDYNRYAYVANNPLKYTDPSGNYRPNTNGAVDGGSSGGGFWI